MNKIANSKVTNGKTTAEFTSLPEAQWCENPLWVNMLCSCNVISISGQTSSAERCFAPVPSQVAVNILTL